VLGGRAARQARDAQTLWRLERALARVRVVDDVVAEHATSYCGRPARRRDIPPLTSAVELPGARWSIDGELVVEFLASEVGPGRLVVHDVALLAPLKKLLRSRHVSVEHVSAAWLGPARR
jgi:hypothetical protein